MSNQTSNQSQSQTSSSVQSSIPRFGSSTSEPAHSFGLPNSLASAPCMWPIAFAGNSRAQDTKDNNKQLALRMNCNNSVYHNGTSTEKRQLMSAQFNSVSRNRNTSLQKSPSDHITPNTTGNLSHFESKLSAESSRNSHLPLFGTSTLSTANRAKSLPNSRHNLSYIPGSQPIDVDETDLTLSHSNLPLRFGIADHSKHNIIGKTQQANLKMSQPTKTTTHPMGLIKSQSLKFESNRNNSNAVIFVSPKVKGEASKSLETVETVDNLDIYSKLPRTLTSSSNAIISKMASGLKDEYECMFDEQTSTSNNQTRGSLSRSSTASLGVLSNLNDILPDDYCDVDTIEMNARLAAIDELISPMPSLNPISAKESIFKCPSTDFIESNDKQPDILSHNPDKLENMHSSEINSLADTISETEVISLNSIDMVETKGDVDIQSQETNSKSNKCKTTNIKSSKAFVKPTGSVASHLPSKIQTSISSTNRLANLSRLAAPKSTRIATNNKNKSTLTSNLGIKNTITSNKRMDFNMNRKASSNKSSLPSSSNGSRISTPTPSEMEFGDHDSIGSTASSTVSLTKAISSKLTYQQSNVTNRRLTQRVLATNTKPITNEANKSKIKSIPTKQDYVPGATISRSSTYTRYLNNATNNFVSKGPENRSKILSTNGSEQAMKLKTNLRNESKATDQRKTFSRPATNYLKTKTTTTTATGVKASISQSSAPKRPSSVASNVSTKSQQSTLNRNKKTSTQNSSSSGSHTTAKRSPTITLLSSAATKSGQSSRRSSITSPNKLVTTNSRRDEADLLQQLADYQARYLQQCNHIRMFQTAIKNSDLKANALLVLNSYLINEYSPFDTPKLRIELASLLEKNCNLHRDYELAKETTFQKDNMIDLLNVKLNDARNENENHLNNIKSLTDKISILEGELLSLSEKDNQLEANFVEIQQELSNEKEARLNAETRLEQLELSCRSDKKYRDLKEKLSTYQKEVDSLNVVVDMKTQRTRHLESEIMRIEMELTNYENLKEAYQRLSRENEALTETLGMKARKNAEQSREIEQLRNEFKREVNERKRTSIRCDQLEYQLNETREMLADVSVQDISLSNCDPKEEGVSRMHSYLGSVSHSKQPHCSQRAPNRSYVRRLFSTPSISDESRFNSRQHHQHQNPLNNDNLLPDFVLSSIGANWQHNRSSLSSTPLPNNYRSQQEGFSTQHQHHDHSELSTNKQSVNSSSPLPQPKMTSSKRADPFNDFPNSSPSVSSSTT